MGCIGQVAGDAYNARRVALAAGMPVRTPAFTVNRLCGSGLQAIWSGAQELLWGGVDVVVAGGDENMTRMPFYDFNARFNDRLGDRTLVDGTVAMLTDPFSGTHMGVTAENVAAQVRGIAGRAGRVRGREPAPCGDGCREGGVRGGDRAGHDRRAASRSRSRSTSTREPGTTLETLAGLRPAFQEDGSVTAGNSSGINDGAARDGADARGRRARAGTVRRWRRSRPSRPPATSPS